MTLVPETQQIFDEVIQAYALKYLSDYQGMSLLQYLEFYCNGPILLDLINRIGPRSVLLKLEASINSLKN